MVSHIIEESETPERHYTITPTQFIKRELLPSEYHNRLFGDKGTIVPSLVRERLENEKDALNFIAANTTIPVPRVLDFKAEHGICSLIVERIPGTTMEELMYTASEQDKATLIDKVTIFIETIVRPELKRLQSNKLGGICGHVLPPPRVSLDNRLTFHSKVAPDNRFHFCHNDLARWNIMIDPQTLEVLSLIDWEYSGFYPPEFEYDFWHRSLSEQICDDCSAQTLRNWMNEPGEKVLHEWTSILANRHCTLTTNTFIKRELWPHEKTQKWTDDDENGKTLLMPWSHERLQNEKDALELLAKYTTIPVPRVLEISEIGPGVRSLTMTAIAGESLQEVLSELCRRDKSVLIENVQYFIARTLLPQLRSLRSGRLGGIGGVVIPSPRVWRRDGRLVWGSGEEAPGDRYGYCHNSLERADIVVDPRELRVVGVRGWEYSGYFPEEFECQYWQRPWPSAKDPAEIEHLIGVLDELGAGQDSTQKRALVDGGGGEEEHHPQPDSLSHKLIWAMSPVFFWVKTTKFHSALYILFAPFRRWRP